MKDQTKPGEGLSRSMRAAAAVNLRTIYADLYRADETPRLLRVPAAKYLTLKPRHPYKESHLIDHMAQLYDVGFAVKTHCRQENPKYRPYKMAMVEVLSWGNEPDIYFVSGPRHEWHWHLILRSPAFVTEADLQAGLAALTQQGKSFIREDIALQVLDEGECVQALLRGIPRDDMDMAIRAKKFAREHGVMLTGLQHEIFMTNVQHVRPQVREVVFRFPVKPIGSTLTVGPTFK